jgi:predicted helicase
MLARLPDLKLPTYTDEKGKEVPVSKDEPFVLILDPATGTATFIVETIDVIYRHLTEKWKKARMSDAQRAAAWNEYVPRHLLPRLFAYELMMAPYAIAHMKVGLKLAETGYQFGSEERVRIYLTNALEPSQQQLRLPDFEPLAHEAEAVNRVKREKRFTVVIGNPPYSGNSSNRGEWIESLINEYRMVDGKPLGEVKVWLKDDYVKFTRFSEQLLETTHVGILGFITNNSFFDGLTFRGMRHHLLSRASCGYFMNLHGNGNLKERAPDGSPDENVFDILQGVGITLLLKSNVNEVKPEAFSADLYGTREVKYQYLNSNRFSKSDYVATNPKTPNYFVVRQNEKGRDEYELFVRVPDLFGIGGLGFQSHRDNFVVAHSSQEIIARMKVFFDPGLSDKEVKERFDIDDYRRFVVSHYRRQNKFDKSSVHRLQYRPFDYRHIYYARDIVQEWQIRFHGHLLKPNIGLNVMRQTKAPEWRHVMVSSTPTPAVFVEIKDGSSQFPLWRYTEIEDSIFGVKGGRVPNLNDRVVSEWFLRLHVEASWLSSKSERSAAATPEDIFAYSYAVLHSPSYRSRYAEFLKIDFPRIPLTENIKLFRELAGLGEELASFHLLESAKLTNHTTQFVGSSREVVKVGWADNTVWIDAVGKKSETQAGINGFRGVPENVWNFHIGGYQVCEKWLKDRKGRILSNEDITHYHKIVISLQETIRLMAEIDQVIQKHGGWPGAFATTKPPAVTPDQPSPASPKAKAKSKPSAPHNDLGLHLEGELPL